MTELSLSAMTGAAAARVPLDIGPGKAPARAADESCGDFGIRIDRGGTWYYHGSPIGRLPLVKLFASVLRQEEDGSYWLVTPAERGLIEVEDVPFIAVSLDVQGSGRDQILAFTTNLEDRVEAGENHPLRIVTGQAQDEPRPYIHIRNTLEARLSRPVFYQLVDLGLEETIDGEQHYGVWSNGKFYQIGSLAEET